jgi:hypothetical protein
MAPVNKRVVIGGSEVEQGASVLVIVGKGVSVGGSGVSVTVDCTNVELGRGVSGKGSATTTVAGELIVGSAFLQPVTRRTSKRMVK